MKLCYIANMPKSKNSDIELTLILSEWRFLRMSFWMTSLIGGKLKILETRENGKKLFLKALLHILF